MRAEFSCPSMRVSSDKNPFSVDLAAKYIYHFFVAVVK